MASRKSKRSITTKNVIPIKKTSTSRTQSDCVNSTFDYTESDDEPFDEKATKRSFRVRKNKETKLTKASKLKNDNIDVSADRNEKGVAKQASRIPKIKKNSKEKGKGGAKKECDEGNNTLLQENKRESASMNVVTHDIEDEEMNDQTDIDNNKVNLTGGSHLKKIDLLNLLTNSQGHVSYHQDSKPTKIETLLRNCPLCATEFSKDTTEEELNRHVNSCLDSKTKGPPDETDTQSKLSTCQNERTTNLEVSNSNLKDEEFAKTLQNRELEKITEENLTNELLFCSLCQKDLSRLNAATREVHMNKCADIVEKEALQIQKAKRKSLQESSKEFDCLICGMQFSTMQLRISHMKQCCETHNVDRKELLYVVRSEQTSRQSPADSDKIEGQEQNPKTVNETLKMPSSATRNRSQGKVTEGSLKPERKKRIQRKKIRNQEVPAILLRSEDEARQIANQRATKLIEEQLCLQDDVKKSVGPSLPPSGLASKYQQKKREIKDVEKTSEDEVNSAIDKTQPVIANSSLWQMAETSVSLHNTSNFYVHEVFEEDLQMTRERLQNEATELLTKELNISTTVGENIRKKNSLGSKTRANTAYEPSPKASRFEESFTMTQAEKVAVLERLGMDAENTAHRVAELECSGFIKVEDLQNDEIAQNIQKLKATAQVSLASNFKALLEDETHKDIRIMCAEGKTIRAHKIILLARCPRILPDDEFIDLRDYSAEAVNGLMMYLYSGEVTQYDVSCAEELLKLARRFSLDVLAEMCLLLKGDSELEERLYTEREDLRTPDVNEVVKTLWEGEDTEDMDKVDAEEQDEDDAEDSVFDENDADDLRSFFVTQREQVVPDDPEIGGLESGNIADDMASSQGRYGSITGRQNGLLDVGLTIDIRAWTERKSCDVDERSFTPNGVPVYRKSEAERFLSTANDENELRIDVTKQVNEHSSTISSQDMTMSAARNQTKGSIIMDSDSPEKLRNGDFNEDANTETVNDNRIRLDHSPALEISCEKTDRTGDDIPMISADEYANIDVVDEQSFRAICDRHQNDEIAKNGTSKSEDREIEPNSSTRVELGEGEQADNVFIVDNNEGEKRRELSITINNVERLGSNRSPDLNERPRNSVINVNDSSDKQSINHVEEDELTQKLNAQKFVDEDYFGSDDSQGLDNCIELGEEGQEDNELGNNENEEKEIEDFTNTTNEIEIRGSNDSPNPSEGSMDRVILVPASPEKQPVSNEEKDEVAQDPSTQDSVEENYFDSDDSEGLDKAICQVDDDFEMTSEGSTNLECRVDDFDGTKLMENKFIFISPDRTTPKPLENTFMTPLLFSTYKDNTPQPRLRELSNDIPVYDNDPVTDDEQDHSGNEPRLRESSEDIPVYDNHPATDDEKDYSGNEPRLRESSEDIPFYDNVPATEDGKDHSGSEPKNVFINSLKAIDLTDNEENLTDASMRSTAISPRPTRNERRNDDVDSRDEGGRSDAVIDLCDDVSMDEPPFHAEANIADESPKVGAEDRSFNCGDIEFNVDQESFLEKHQDSDDDLSEPASPCVTKTQCERKLSNEGSEGNSQGNSQIANKNLSYDNSGSSKNDLIDIEADVPTLSSEFGEERDKESPNSCRYGAIDSGNSSDEVIDTTPKKSRQKHTTSRGSPMINLEIESPVSSSGKWLQAHSEIIPGAAEASSSRVLSPRRKSTPKGGRRANLVSASSTVSDEETNKRRRKTKMTKSTPSRKKSPPKKRTKQDTTCHSRKGAFKELLKRVSNEIDRRETSDSDVAIGCRKATKYPSTSDEIEELQTSRTFSEVEALSPNQKASNSPSTSDEIEELQTSRTFSEVEALSPNRTSQLYSLSMDKDNNSKNSCGRTHEISRNRRTVERFDATVGSNRSPSNGSQLTKSSVEAIDLSGHSANDELPMDVEDREFEDDCVVSYPSFSQSFGDDGGFNVDICTQGQAGDNRSLKGSQTQTSTVCHGLNAGPTLDTNNDSIHSDRNVTISHNDLPAISSIDDGGFNCDIAGDVVTDDGESNVGSPSVVKVAAWKRSTKTSIARQRIRISSDTEPGVTETRSPSLKISSHSREMNSSLQEACTPLSDATSHLPRNVPLRLDVNCENLTTNEESRDENDISNLGDLSSLNCDSEFLTEDNEDAGQGFSSVSEHMHDNNETLQGQEPLIATPQVHAPTSVRDTPSTAVRNFKHGIGVHPETGDAVTPMSDYDSLSTPALTKRVKGFGIRKIAKRQMAGKMREIYKMQHGFQNWEEPPPKAQRKTKQKKTKTDVGKRKAGSAKGKVVAHDNEETGQSSSSSNEEGQMTFEGGNCSDDETSSQSSRTEENEESLAEKLLKFIKSNTDLYQKILTYQKLNLDDFFQAVKESGIKCSIHRLMDFLDEQCICFRSDDRPRTIKHRRNPKT